MKLVRILLPIDQDGTSEACAEAAFILAERFGVRLEILHPCLAAWQRLPYASELSPFYFQELINTGGEQVAFEKGAAKAWCDQALGVRPEAKTVFASIEGLIAPTVAMRARVADFAVVPSIEAGENAFWGSVRDAALFHSGRPMLAVPKGSAGSFGETVVVAWKDSAESTRAVAAASPFLATAKRVRLIAVEEADEEDQSLPAMADYLKLAGLKVDVAKIEQGTREIGETLLEAASAAKGAMLVMGAYGHQRWKEWAFGGVTQHVLRNATMPVLMMH
jgi:nucleotide-binding universal stress UspA family protein